MLALISLAVVAALAAVITLLAPPSLAGTDATCSTGTYNYRQTMTGGCAWGNVKVRANTSISVNVVVHDSASDGQCARVELGEVRSLAWDATIDTAQACGGYAPLQFSEGCCGSVPGYIEAWRLRVCVASTCTAWKQYSSSTNVG
jgi:hypothetical protein